MLIFLILGDVTRFRSATLKNSDVIADRRHSDKIFAIYMPCTV
jgi:hypothetical protein